MAEPSRDEPFLVPPGWVRSEMIRHPGGDTFRLLHYVAGPFTTTRFEHRCFRQDGSVICAPAMPGHAIDWTTLTVTPSIVCPDCGLHGFIRNGGWIDA